MHMFFDLRPRDPMERLHSGPYCVVIECPHLCHHITCDRTACSLFDSNVPSSRDTHWCSTYCNDGPWTNQLICILRSKDPCTGNTPTEKVFPSKQEGAGCLAHWPCHLCTLPVVQIHLITHCGREWNGAEPQWHCGSSVAAAFVRPE